MLCYHAPSPQVPTGCVNGVLAMFLLYINELAVVIRPDSYSYMLVDVKILRPLQNRVLQGAPRRYG